MEYLWPSLAVAALAAAAGSIIQNRTDVAVVRTRLEDMIARLVRLESKIDRWINGGE